MQYVKKEAQYTDIDKYKCLEFLRENSVELSLSYCGKESCPPGHVFGPFAREEYLLHYILEGKGRFEANGKIWNLGKNDAFLILPKETTVYSADIEEPWTYIWVGFNGLKAFECLEQAGFSNSIRTQHYKKEKMLTQCIDTILDAHQLTYANDMIRQSQLITFLATMIQEQHEVFKKSSSNKAYPQQAYIDYAVHYIENNYQNSININDICQYVGITRGYLTKIFQQALHTAPYDYLLKVRMNKAMSLLKTTTLPIYQVANLVGYSDALVFSKTFKQRTGISPKTYRSSSNSLVFSDHKELPILHDTI